MVNPQLIYATNKVVLKALFAFSLLLVLNNGLFGKVPNDNPYTQYYNIEDHWTDSINWKNIVEAQNVKGLIGENTVVDSLRMCQTVDAISREGGGILYFGEGNYYFDFDLGIGDGVVIRGVGPNVKNAKADGYLSPTKFIFPKYKPNFSGKGTPNSTAFKKIYAISEGMKNFGLVNLDINRARIEFHASLTDDELKNVQKGKRFFAENYHENILIFGIRQNNAAAPDPSIPTNFMIDEDRGWQRWPSQAGANIDIIVNRNCIIANCRLNDSTTDNYEQPDYLVHSGKQIDGVNAKFKFDFHPAIWINVRTFDSLFFENIQATDNFIITSSYWDKIVIKGENVLVANNRHNGSNFKNDLYVDGNGKWEIDLEWKKYANDELIFEKGRFLGSNLCDTIPYRLLRPQPENKQKYPLVIFFHGIGEHGKDNSLQLRHLIYYFAKDEIRKKYPAYVLAPQIPGKVKWFKDLKGKSSEDGLIDEIKKWMNQYSIDTDRIYLIGISSGGKAALETIVLYPKLFASVVAVSSLVLFEEENIKKIKNTSVAFYYGVDDQEIPHTYYQLIASRLDKNNIKNKVVAYKDVAHAIWPIIGEDETFYEWLFSQRR